MNKLLIFDLDGTLVDCKQLHQVAFKSAIGGKRYPEKQVEGLPTVRKIEILNESGWDLDPDTVSIEKQCRTFELFDEYIHYDAPLHARLSELSQRYDLAICSNATRKFVEAVVDRLNIRLLLSVGIFTATEYASKPATEQWDSCIESWAGELDRVVIFEDSPVGIRGAERTGCRVVSVKDAKDLLEKLNEF